MVVMNRMNTDRSRDKQYKNHTKQTNNCVPLYLRETTRMRSTKFIRNVLVYAQKAQSFFFYFSVELHLFTVIRINLIEHLGYKIID